MLSSYQFSERYNAQSLLWGGCGLIVATVRKIAAIVGRAFAIVSHLLYFIAGLEPYILGIMTGLTLGLAMFAVVSAIPPTFWLGLLIVGAYAWATYPRTAVRK